MLVPCGHSVCGQCVASMERNAEISVLGTDKYCPLCRQVEGAEDLDAEGEDGTVPVDSYDNRMLEAMLARLRTKLQDIASLVVLVQGLERRFRSSDSPRAKAPGVAFYDGEAGAPALRG
uniref:RING-type domain-containing protein n=2 Tax=Chrysotila carterae TaxID=13221 RepID=A0A7S4ET30_CHRCT